MIAQKREVAVRLRQHREACALSQKQVADALNIERSTYTKYETGAAEPNLNTLVKLAAIYNVSPTELLPIDVIDEAQAKRLRDAVRADSPIYQLSKDERGLIAKYRALDRDEKKQALEMMGKMSKKEPI